MTIELAIAAEYANGNLSVKDMKDMRKRFYSLTMKTGSQYRILNLIIEKIEQSIEHFEKKNEQQLNNLETQVEQ